MKLFIIIIIIEFIINGINLFISYPNGALNYTFVQAAERMRRIRCRCFPLTPQNISHLHNLLLEEENSHFVYTFQNPPKM